jgi:hypothetical protein
LKFGKFTGAGEGGIAINLREILEIRRLEKVSPPFEGGVAGTIDYLMFTILISRPGWLIFEGDINQPPRLQTEFAIF